MKEQTPATPAVQGAEAPSAHRPVLLHELIERLHPSGSDVVVDGTFGQGEMTNAILERLDPDGRIIGIDLDPEAVRHGTVRFVSDHRVKVIHGSYAAMEDILHLAGIDGADVVLLDLGYSSNQIEDPSRGMSFMRDGPLDMRFDPTQGHTARDILNTYDEAALTTILLKLGDERWAAAIARTIIRMRESHPLERTGDLVACVESAIPRRAWPQHIHPATKTFQALRIAVNDELGTIERGVQSAIRILRPGGRLGVISFHSLEDTLVKNLLHVSATPCVCPPQQTFCTCAHRVHLFLPERKAIKPTPEEAAANPRSRSARLRIAIRK
ncbi:MAG: 16S rRNA (cytosine(1402)-N(4))-methyltransferase RsmH [Candidatus Dormibacteria bacterium]